MGRRDSTTASRAAANTSIPPPTSNLSALISSFSAQGLSLKNMVALAGNSTVVITWSTLICYKLNSVNPLTYDVFEIEVGQL